MKKLLTLFLLSITLHVSAQTNDTESIRQAGFNYLDGFYKGDTVKLKQCLSAGLHKYGYFKGKSGQFEGDPMTYQQAIDFAVRVLINKKFASDTAPREVVILDQQEFVASIKITAWWGIDYALLSKKSGNWKIEQILWQGPLNTIRR